MTSNEIRARIRAMVESGEVPCDVPEHVWAGRGEGYGCAGCGDPIRPGDIEFEVVLSSGMVIRLHRACHVIWLEECETMAS